MKYKQHAVDGEGWTDWIYPKMDGYRMGCCDCGLVHELRFVIVDDAVAFQARRDARATAGKRRSVMPVQLKTGDIIQDNDPRMPDRRLVITFIGRRSGIEAKVIGTKRTVSISHKRVFADNKPRRHGFNLVHVEGADHA